MARRIQFRQSSAPRRSSGADARASGWTPAVLGALLGLLLALVLFAPARWLTGGIASATDGRLLLDHPRGTIWNGSAQLVFTGGSGSTDAAALPERLQWQLRPHWQGLRLQLNSACCTPEPLLLTLRAGFGGIDLEVADGRSSWPAALLAGLGTPFNTLQPEGTLSLATTGLRVLVADGRMALSGRADIDVLDMASSVSQLRPLGSYRLSLSGGSVPEIQLSTLSGPLQLSGSGSWVGQRLRFTGEARALPERAAALATLLNLLGRRDGARSVITLG